MIFKPLQIAIYLAAVSLMLGCGKETKTESEEQHGEHHPESERISGEAASPSFNERKLAHITERVNGRIEKLYAFTNERGLQFKPSVSSTRSVPSERRRAKLPEAEFEPQ